jgi:hypothetical protein
MHWVSSQLGGMWKIEWISDTGGNNLHRNVLFHENGAREFDIRRTAEYVLPVPRGKGKYILYSVLF